jgi:hypothetical protein
MSSGVTHILVLFVHLGIILILVLRFYSGLSGRVRTVYLFRVCVISPFSMFTAIALVWFSNKYFPLSRGCKHVSHGVFRAAIELAWATRGRGSIFFKKFHNTKFISSQK